MEIGDIVDIKVDDNVQGVGALLGVSSNHPLCNFWMVLLLRRNTEFLKNCAEKALNIPDGYLSKYLDELSLDEQITYNWVFGPEIKSCNIKIGECEIRDVPLSG